MVDFVGEPRYSVFHFKILDQDKSCSWRGVHWKSLQGNYNSLR